MNKKTNNKNITIVGQFVEYDECKGDAKLMFIDSYDPDDSHTPDIQKKFTRGYITQTNARLRSSVVVDPVEWNSPLDGSYFNVRCVRKRKQTRYFVPVYDISGKRIPIEDAQNHTVCCKVKFDSYIIVSPTDRSKKIAGWYLQVKEMKIIKM